MKARAFPQQTASTFQPSLSFREGDADFNVAESCRGGSVPRAHYLLGLALAAVGRAPQRPIIARADGVAAVPEFRGDSAVAGILDHAPLLPALNFPPDFGRKLEMIALVINGPGAIRFH